MTQATLCLAEHTHSQRLMGNRFDFSVVDPNPEEARAHLEAAVAEVKRIEALLTTFSETSQTAAINRMAGICPVAVDQEVFDLLERSVKISMLTQGAFDLTYGALDKSLWNFDPSITALPSPEIAQKSVRLINWRDIELNERACTIFLKKQGMRLGFGGIGKGYAADRAKIVLQKRGANAGVINASGDLCAWGTRADGSPWTVGISNPDCPSEILARFNLGEQAVATSGNYEKYAIINGKRYSHTIDPRTGMPATGLKSVTVVAPYAELADALTTPVIVMGLKAGLNLLNQLHGIAGVLMTDDNHIFTTHNISI